MDFDLTQLPPRDAYKLLSGLVTPRPIALITTLSETNVVNAAPFSFFNVVGSDPPLVVFAPGYGSPHTAGNIRHNSDFVVNIVDEAIAEAMNVCAVDFPETISELGAAGLTTAASARVLVPRIAEAPASLECREHSTLLIGNNRMVIGEVLHVHTRDDLVDDKGRIIHEQLKTIGRLAGSGYSRTRDTFEMQRLNYEEWKKATDKHR